MISRNIAKTNLCKVVEAPVYKGEAKAFTASLHLQRHLLHLLPWDDLLLPKTTAPKYDLASSWAVRRLLGCYERTCMTPTLVESELADVVLGITRHATLGITRHATPSPQSFTGIDPMSILCGNHV